MRRLAKLLVNERGTSAVEYALILAFVFLALLAGAVAVGGTTQNMWDNVSSQVIGAH